MAKVIAATENGPGLFNALSIALGIEILSGRLDNQKDSPGYIHLLDEFEIHHPAFKDKKSWDNLKHWLAFYNNSIDMETILAPVLFSLHQKYPEFLEQQIQQDLFTLIWENREAIESGAQWWQLKAFDDNNNILFPRLDQLSKKTKDDLLKKMEIIIQTIISDCKSKFDEDNPPLIEVINNHVKELLIANSVEIVQDLKKEILDDKEAYFGVYRCGDLDSMANALNLCLIENRADIPSGNKNKIQFQRKEQRWNVVCDEVDILFINGTPQRLKANIIEAFQGKISVAAPTPQEIEQLSAGSIVIKDEVPEIVKDEVPEIVKDEVPEIIKDEAPEIVKDEAPALIKERMIDNPGLGNCAFYAFAIALIDIIQKEKADNSKAMFEHWVSIDKDLADKYEAICSVDFTNRNKELLDNLQTSLRHIAYNFQLDELKKACVTATAEDDLETKHPDKNSSSYKNALKYKYKDITANTNYLNFAALYFGKSLDIDPRFNPFAKSAAITNAIYDLDRNKIEDTYEELALAPLFLKLIFGDEQAAKPITESTEPVKGSSIIEGMKNIIKEFFWGLHQDLCDLAAKFMVNLHTLENGINPRNEGAGDLAGRHTITVNNLGNYHWITQITIAKKEPVINSGNDEHAPLLNEINKAKDSEQSEDKESEIIDSEESELLNELDYQILDDALKDLQDIDEAPKPRLENEPTKAKPVVHSQEELLALREKYLKILDSTNTQDSDKKIDPVQKEKLQRLQRAVSNATIAYTSYSDNILFSIFHRHGNTGRVRAKAFNTAFAEIDNYDEAKEQLIKYLSNNHKNGNTHPHSFRTMLMHEVLDEKSKPTLQYTSAHFKDLLASLSSAFNVSLPEDKQESDYGCCW